MKETRRYKITQKVFTKDDLRKIGQILLTETQSASKAGEHSRISLQLICSDNTSYETESLELFADDGIVDTKVPGSINMSFWNYTKDLYIDLELNHGGGYGNSLVVRGNDSNWVSGTFIRIKDIIDSAQPQNNWIIRHPTLFLHMIALGLGAIIVCVLDFTLTSVVFPSLSPDAESIESGRKWIGENFPKWLLHYFEFVDSSSWAACVDAWFRKWIIGLGLGAFPLRRWVFELWPDIELDFGPEHLKIEKTRRKRLALVFSVIIIPVICDIIKILITT